MEQRLRFGVREFGKRTPEVSAAHDPVLPYQSTSYADAAWPNPERGGLNEQR